MRFQRSKIERQRRRANKKGALSGTRKILESLRAQVKCPKCGFQQPLRHSDWLCPRCAEILCVSQFKKEGGNK